jgi:hypothetical protein
MEFSQLHRILGELEPGLSLTVPKDWISLNIESADDTERDLKTIELVTEQACTWEQGSRRPRIDVYQAPRCQCLAVDECECESKKWNGFPRGIASSARILPTEFEMSDQETQAVEFEA